MNIYFVDAGEVTFYGNEWEPPETGRVVGLVRAETRSQAQYLLWKSQLQREGDLEEFDYKTRLVAKDVAGEKGDVSYERESEGWWRLAAERENCGSNKSAVPVG